MFRDGQVCDRWLTLRLDVLGNVLVCASALLALQQRGDTYAGLAGLSIDYALQITFTLGFLVRNGALLETQLNAVERVTEYSDDLTPEAPLVVESCRPPEGWPSRGAIEFHALSMRYREGLDLVLRSVSLSVQPGETVRSLPLVGLCGRRAPGPRVSFTCRPGCTAHWSACLARRASRWAWWAARARASRR